jgi:hypothetical protein
MISSLSRRRRSVEPARSPIINPITMFLASDNSARLTGEQLLATGGIR